MNIKIKHHLLIDSPNEKKNEKKKKENHPLIKTPKEKKNIRINIKIITTIFKN